MLKLKEVVSEGWWDVLSKKAQAVYKKAHPGSQQAQSAKDTDGSEPEDKPFGGDTGKDADYDMGEPDNAEQLKKLDQEIQALDDAKWKAVDSGDGAAIRNWGEKLQKAKAKREKMSRTGNELNQETLTIDGKQFRRITEGKINTKFIKYRVYDKIADEINKVEPDDFNLRKFEPLKRKLISFVQREVKRDRKMGTMSVLKQAWKRADIDDKVFGRSGIIDDWYKKSERDFPKFLKRNPNLKWKNYNASSLTYGISKSLYKIVDSLLDGINSLVPESKHAFSEFYKRFKK